MPHSSKYYTCVPHGRCVIFQFHIIFCILECGFTIVYRYNPTAKSAGKLYNMNIIPVRIISFFSLQFVTLLYIYIATVMASC